MLAKARVKESARIEGSAFFYECCGELSLDAALEPGGEILLKSEKAPAGAVSIESGASGTIPQAHILAEPNLPVFRSMAEL